MEEKTRSVIDRSVTAVCAWGWARPADTHTKCLKKKTAMISIASKSHLCIYNDSIELFSRHSYCIRSLSPFNKAIFLKGKRYVS